MALAKCNQKPENKRALLVLFTVQSASEDTKQVRRVEKGLEEQMEDIQYSNQRQSSADNREPKQLIQTSVLGGLMSPLLTQYPSVHTITLD